MTVITAPNRPDPKVLDRFASAENSCLLVATLISVAVLGGWMVPAVGAALPDGWSLMRASTALAVLLCVASLALTRSEGNIRLLLAGRACACAVLFLGSAGLFEYWSGRNSGFDTLLAADSEASTLGRMSIQTASFLVLLGLSLLIERTRQDLLGHVLDALIVAIACCAIVFVAGYIFGATALLGQTLATRTSPQSLVCLALLTFVQTSRRAPYGFFSVL